MKTLIVYYSRTGTTKKVAEHLARELHADIDEIVDLKNRKGPMGYIVAGKDAMQKSLTVIGPMTKDISKYDLLVIGSPVWSWTLAPAVRSYVAGNKSRLKGKRFAFFVTRGGEGDEKSFTELEGLLQSMPLAKLTLLTKEVAKGEYHQKVRDFVAKLRK